MGSLYGYEVVSDLPLHRLSDVPGVRGRVRVERGPDSLLDQHGKLTGWHEWPDLDDQHFAVFRTPARLIVSCSVTGTYELDPAARRVRVADTALDHAWEHRLGTTALPLLLVEQGDLALHASAVCVGEGAVLFCGPTGRGKSTLALLASTLGHRVISEDGAVIDLRGGHPLAFPGPLGVTVSDGSVAATEGRGPAAEPFGNAGRPRRRQRALGARLQASGQSAVSALCYLSERGERLAVSRLAAAEGLVAVAPSLLHGGGAAALRPAFALLARLVAGVRVYRVAMPDDLSQAREATRSLLAQVTA